MARTSICGFELGENIVSAIQAVDPSPSNLATSYSSEVVRTGGFSLKVSPLSGLSSNAASTTDGVLAFGNYNRIYMRVTSLPSSAQRVVLGSSSTINIKLGTNGTLSFYNGSTLIGTSSTALTDSSKWYRVEWRLANGSNVTILKIDGNDEVTGSPSSWTMQNWIGASDSVSGTYTVYFDDFAADDSEWPGDGKVVLLVPASDNTISNWTAGAGGTSDLYIPVKTLPPPGVSSANETNSTNIESNSNSGTANYIAQLQTYASKGITSSEIITRITLVVVHGEDIATGTKSGSVELTSNPVVSAGTFTFGNNSGAHGNYNDTTSLWRVFSKSVNDPSGININNNPLMKVVKTDATTRTACVCSMVLYVEAVPAPSGQPTVLRSWGIPTGSGGRIGGSRWN